jgi:hypothetical protein
MGTGIRIFFVHDDGSLKRFPVARFERLFQGHPEEYLPEYAEKRVRYALVTLDLENRKPVEILGIGYHILTFDSEGKIDANELQSKMRLWVDQMPNGTATRTNPKIVDAEPLFLQKRYNNRYNWKPTLEIEAAIFKAIFGKRQ